MLPGSGFLFSFSVCLRQCTLPSAECLEWGVVGATGHAKHAIETIHTTSSCWEDTRSRGWMPRRCVPMKDVA